MRSTLSPTLFLPSGVNGVRGLGCPINGNHLTLIPMVSVGNLESKTNVSETSMDSWVMRERITKYNRARKFTADTAHML